MMDVVIRDFAHLVDEDEELRHHLESARRQLATTMFFLSTKYRSNLTLLARVRRAVIEDLVERHFPNEPLSVHRYALVRYELLSMAMFSGAVTGWERRVNIAFLFMTLRAASKSIPKEVLATVFECMADLRLFEPESFKVISVWAGGPDRAMRGGPDLATWRARCQVCREYHLARYRRALAQSPPHAPLLKDLLADLRRAVEVLEDPGRDFDADFVLGIDTSPVYDEAACVGVILFRAGNEDPTFQPLTLHARSLSSTPLWREYTIELPPAHEFTDFDWLFCSAEIEQACRHFVILDANDTVLVHQAFNDNETPTLPEGAAVIRLSQMVEK